MVEKEMPRQSTQEVTLPEVFQSRKKRSSKNSPTYKTEPGYTKVKDISIAPQSSVAECGPEIVWDNSSPSPAKEPSRRSRRNKKEIQEILKKISNSQGASSSKNVSLRDQGLLKVWMQNSSAAAPEAGFSSPVEKANKHSKDKGKTPKRVVGRQRCRLRKFDANFQDELCKIAMALSKHSEQVTKEKPWPEAESREISNENLDVDLDLFKDDIETFVENVEIKELKAANSTSARKSLDTSSDVFLDDDFEACLLDDVVSQCSQSMQSKEPGNNGCVNEEDLFEDEDCDLTLALQLYEAKSMEESIPQKPPIVVNAAVCKTTAPTTCTFEKISSFTSAANTKHALVQNHTPLLNSRQASRYSTHKERVGEDVPKSVAIDPQQSVLLPAVRLNSDFGNVSHISKTNLPLIREAFEDEELFLDIQLDVVPMSSTQKCNADEIAEKKRLAMERLAKNRRKRNTSTAPVPPRKVR